MMLNEEKIHFRATKVYYLSMEQPPVSKAETKEGVSFARMEKPLAAALYLHYYHTVGFHLNWLDRMVMPKNQLEEKINASNVHIYVMKVRTEDAGFVELVQEENSVEILYFGLFPHFVGKGLGKYFLQWCIEKAWSFHPQKVQLNTCDLDHSNALPTYKKLGFKEYKTEWEQRRVFEGQE